MSDIIKYLINKTRRILPFTSANAVITESGYSVQYELDKLRTDIRYYIEMYDPEYVERLATSARYARDQGDYAHEQGLYIYNNTQAIVEAIDNSNHAKDQGDYAKDQGDYAKGQGEYIEFNKNAIDAALLNSSYAQQQGDRAKDYADYISENITAINNSVENSNDAYRYATYARGYKNYVDTIARRVVHGSRIFNVPEPTLHDNP